MRLYGIWKSTAGSYLIFGFFSLVRIAPVLITFSFSFGVVSNNRRRILISIGGYRALSRRGAEADLFLNGSCGYSPKRETRTGARSSNRTPCHLLWNHHFAAFAMSGLGPYALFARSPTGGGDGSTRGAGADEERGESSALSPALERLHRLLAEPYGAAAPHNALPTTAPAHPQPPARVSRAA